MISITPLIDSFSVNFTPSTELDVTYYLTHAVHASDLVNGDFTPSEANLINRGPDTNFVWKTSRNGISPFNGDWYVKIAAVDSFGEDVLNYTTPCAVTVPEFSFDFPSSQRTDFWVHDSIFSFDLPPATTTTLRWTEGSVVRGNNTYSLAAGSIANAHGAYLVATLNITGSTATISSSSVLAGIPTIGDNQVILGCTSSEALGGGTYVAYMRQANSVYYEGAAIRDLTVTSAKIKDVSASKLTAGTIDADVVTIENLIVGDNVTMGPNATLTWGQIDGANKPADNATANIFRGAWAAGSINYVLGDEVTYGGSTWGCMLPHTSTALNYPPTLPTLSNTWWSLRASRGIDGPPGASAIQVGLSNEAHTVPTDSAGDNGDYTNSGTQIHAYEGTTELTYDGVGTANGTWRVAVSASNITAGAISDSGIYATVSEASAMILDAASITFTVSGKTTTGASFSTTKTQTFAKSRAGVAAIGYDIDVESTNGTAFRIGQTKITTLIAHVYSNGVEVTDTIPASKFRWRRVSYIENIAGDAAWNADHATGFKTIALTIDSVDSIATFHCDITE